MDNFILKQTKETVMTMEKTVTTITESLEEVDFFGRKRLLAKTKTVQESVNQTGSDLGRAA